jgi:tRNA nucleotidyltransferase (CCA-adding enzyme)
VWEHFHHQADIGIRGIGRTLDEAFAEAAVALMAVICSPQKVEPKEAVRIHCQGGDMELLFVDWLNELVYEMATRGMLFGRFEVTVAGDELDGRAWGETADPQRHETAVEVKGATYTQLKVAHRDDKWIAQCVVDV